MSWSAISIPLIPQTMLFLRALYPRYKSIIDIIQHRIHQSEIICQMARRTILSQSALDSGLLFFLFTGFLSVFFGRFLLFLDGSNPPRLVFPVPFCWTQGWGVLVRPWSASVA
jgi:hypothetical protein